MHTTFLPSPNGPTLAALPWALPFTLHHLLIHRPRASKCQDTCTGLVKKFCTKCNIECHKVWAGNCWQKRVNIRWQVLTLGETGLWGECLLIMPCHYWTARALMAMHTRLVQRARCVTDYHAVIFITIAGCTVLHRDCGCNVEHPAGVKPATQSQAIGSYLCALH